MILKASHELYAHIDCNCFFVSCERLRRPELRGRMVAVAGDIIVSASYECRTYGVGVTTPIWKAREILGPDLVCVRPDLAYYSKISREFLEFLGTKGLSVEPFSIDEAFVRFTGIPECTHGGDYEAFVSELRDEILARIGIPVSIGLSNTRIKAKILSDINKPFGVCVGLDQEDEDRYFQSLPVRAVPFIGKGMENRLGKSIKTVQDFRNMSFFELDRCIGKNATTLWLELHGIDAWNARDSGRIPKSILRSRSFNQSMSDNRQLLWERMVANFENAYRELSLIGCELVRVAALLRSKEFERVSEEYDFGVSTSDRSRIQEALRACFERAWGP